MAVPRAGPLRLPEAWGESLAKLPPAYFAMSMATGIAAVACHFLGLGAIAFFLFWLNVLAYGILWGLNGARAWWYPREFLADWSDHNRSVGFFTCVAATSVLGTQFAVIKDDLAPGRVLWFAGIGLWLVGTYVIFTALTVKEAKPSLAAGINGGWLVAVVASQSLCVLGCAVAPSFGAQRETVLFASLALWLAGGMLYIWLISLIFYRYTFFQFLPSDLSPPYWINMGALAISTLSGSLLVANAGGSARLAAILPFLKGFTLWYWATATWWIPMLVILGVWRHGIRRFPVRYDAMYWGAVFPLAMYSVATLRLAGALHLPVVMPISRTFGYLGLVAWSLVFAGLIRRLLGLAALARQPQISAEPTAGASRRSRS